MRHLIYIGIFAVAGIVFACKKDIPEQQQDYKQPNAIYYWKTVFRLNGAERKFLTDHNIGRMYIRFFDVAMDDPNQYWTKVNPIATIIFKETPPEDIEIVPTVFITNEGLKSEYFDNSYPSKILKRILTMAETNNIQNIREIQIDCDWTQTTQEKYFNFLRILKDSLAPKGILLSTTIRLHQFSLPAPPVDRGVLMCYNTGNLKDNQSINSILNVSDVQPYVKNIDNYSLPIDVAYPTFSWAVWFHDKRFKAILRSADKADTETYKYQTNNIYTTIQGHYVDGYYVAPGDDIRFENADFQQTMAVKHMLDHKFRNASIILYHLDSLNLSKYSSNEIDQIYNH